MQKKTSKAGILKKIFYICCVLALFFIPIPRKLYPFAMLLLVPILNEMVVVLALSIPVILILHRFKLPSVVGFLLTGILAGPYVFRLVKASEAVDVIAEIGVVLLLFTIGIEFSIPNLLRIKKAVLLGGSLQVLLTTAVFGLMVYLTEYDLVSIAVFIGFLYALSSTAIVLKVLQLRGEMGTPHGQIALAILIFQDIAVVPMMLMMPILAGQADNVLEEILLMVGKMAAVVLFLGLVSKFVIGKLYYWVASTNSKELFISTTVVICFSIAYLTSLAGLSLALGAFLAGLVISESDYSHEATSYILPFKEIFTSIFFISIGMLMDVYFVWENLLMIVRVSFLSITIQAVLATFAALALRVPLKTAILTGLTLAQIGEFSFVLAKQGETIGLMPIEVYQSFMAVSVLTMAIAPILIMNGNKIVYFLMYKVPKPKAFSRWIYAHRKLPDYLNEFKQSGLKDHMVIIGLSLNGASLAKGAHLGGIPYVIIESDPRKIEAAEEILRPHTYFGDASNEEILNHIHISKAKVLVITTSQQDISQHVVHLAKHLNPNITILARTRRASEMKALMKAGADMVVADEIETNIAIFSEALECFYLPKDEIYRLISNAKSVWEKSESVS
jgi:CPA2 family monovalent cation:H+ antiporter-2